jgi:hypothetical protein
VKNEGKYLAKKGMDYYWIEHWEMPDQLYSDILDTLLHICKLPVVDAAMHGSPSKEITYINVKIVSREIQRRNTPLSFTVNDFYVDHQSGLH